MAAPIEIALCFDDHLALPAAVTILSLLEAAASEVRLHVLTDPAPRAAPLLAALAARYGAMLRVVDTAPDARHGLDPTSPYGPPSTATYRRIFLAEQLPELERVLYLDADLLVRRDLRALWKAALGAAPLAAAADPWMASFPEQRSRHPGGYFNAGMLLIDLARWRAQGFTARCIAELGRQQQHAAKAGVNALSYSNDQTALNAVLRGCWCEVAPRWNFTALHTPRVAKALGVAPHEFAETVANPAVVHFLGAYKPWLSGCEEMTPWHAEYHRLRGTLQQDFALDGLTWPGAYTQGAEAVRQRRLFALRLVHRAKTLGFTCPAIVLTGLLGRDVLAVAHEQALDIACFASEAPALAGGALDAMPIVSIAEAVAQGQRDFILADYRRVGWIRAALEDEARRHDAEVRIVAL